MGINNNNNIQDMSDATVILLRYVVQFVKELRCHFKIDRFDFW